MSLRDRERLLRLKTLRAERVTAALAAARAEAEAAGRRLRLAQIALRTREGVEVRMRERAYRDMLGRPLRAAGLDAVDGALLVLKEDTGRARDAAEKAEAALAERRKVEDAARDAAAAAHRAREVWDRLAGRARAEDAARTRARDDAAQEAAVEVGGLAAGGAGQ